MADSNKAHFAPLPLRAISDRRLSGLDRNVLAANAAHDLMSLKRGKGRGCDASLSTLAGQCGCDYSNLSRSISKLIDHGYVESSPKPGDKRQHVYRIPAHLYDYAESWSFHQPSAAKIVGAETNNPEAKEFGDLANNIVEKVGAETNNLDEKVGQDVGAETNDSAKVVGDDPSKNDGNLPNSDDQYISSNDSIKEKDPAHDSLNGTDTAEAARIAPPNDPPPDTPLTVDELLKFRSFWKWPAAKAGPTRPCWQRSTALWPRDWRLGATTMWKPAPRCASREGRANAAHLLQR